ncbi:nuclear transcription factor Y subunit B-9-like [Cucurbita pepo subsp. pepo]|uniref:nuclear transcription factor Y subunit B-9-like n=1 Tax=Cucurbita pepo subsp. pepo TaxID=3664 RepID=UPI000C9D7630|nr:nuclear transcription factor Y subunit B-9-like [Cucurbita pepo subsp. pepo]
MQPAKMEYKANGTSVFSINLSAACFPSKRHFFHSPSALLTSRERKARRAIMECGGSSAAAAGGGGGGGGGGDGFHSYRRQHSKPTSGLNHHLTNGATATGNSPATCHVPVTGANNEQSQQCMVREQDQYMPIANVIRIMRRILPSHAKISDDAKETIQECVSEYISFITGEANERCQREQRKTVTAEDVLWAMGKLGFDDYIEPLTMFLNRYRESESDRVRTEPILRRNVDYVPQVGMMPPYGQAFPLGHTSTGMFDAMGGYYGGGRSGGTSSGNGNQL